MMAEQQPVLIVGAGPTGLTAALELLRFGVPVRLIDKIDKPEDTSRALAVQARTLELLQQRGIAEEMVRLGSRCHFTTVYGNGEPMGTIDFRRIASRFNFILMLPQSETERVLREHLERAGVSVERGLELLDFTQQDTGVTATLRRKDGSTEQVQAAYLIDAEGAHSVARRQLGVEFAGKSLPNTYALADLYSDSDLDDDHIRVFLGEGHLLAAFPMGNRRFRIIATEPEDRPADAPPPTVEEIQELWAASAHRPARMYDPQWTSRFHINSRVVDRMRHDRVFLAGDSAHIHSPAGGQGMNTGIQDMMNLCWKLALVYRGEAKPELLDTFDEERMPVIEEIVATTERATDIFTSHNKLVHTLLTHAMPLALEFDTIRRKGAMIVSELGGSYRKSSLNQVVDDDIKLHAGDRFPDVTVSNDGLRALDVLSPSLFTVLAIGGEGKPDQPEDNVTGWVTKQIAQPSSELLALAGPACAVVVRPDGYIMAAGGANTAGKAQRTWQQKWVPRA